MSNENGATNFKNMDSYVKTSKYHKEQGWNKDHNWNKQIEYRNKQKLHVQNWKEQASWLGIQGASKNHNNKKQANAPKIQWTRMNTSSFELKSKGQRALRFEEGSWDFIKPLL